MDAEGVERRLAAILSADVAGYSRLMAEDEAATIRTLRAYRDQIRGLVGEHRGRVVDAPGDNVLAEFHATRDAVECAVEIQRVVQARNASLPEERRMQFRIGVHLGDIAKEGERIYGDGVNIAARLEGMAEPGGICISGTVHEQIRDKVRARFVDLGEHEVKNLPHPVRMYRVEIPAEGAVPVTAIAPSSRRSVAVATGVLLVAVAAAVWWGRTPGTAPASLPTSIVVLPFADMSPDGDQEYFADGMAEELINTLSKIEGLRVVARTSSFAFKGRNVDIREIGEQLAVGAVVEGSVRKAGDRLRITAQLVQVADGFHLWSETYDRKLGDVFAIQDEIGAAVARALEVRLGSAPTHGVPTQNLRAYELYLTGRHFWNERSEEGLRKAIRYFERALQADPNYALAQAGLADSYLQLWWYGYETRSETLARAEAAAIQALAIAEDSGEAHVALGGVRLLQWRWDEAERELRQAIQLSPGYATAHLYYWWFLITVGRFEEGRAEIQTALELDPLSPVINRNLGMFYIWAGDYARAMKRLQKALELNPNEPLARSFLSKAYIKQGLAPVVFEGFSGQGSRPEVEARLRAAYQEGGGLAFWRASLELRIAETQKQCTERPARAAWILADLGETDRMFQCLQEAVDQRMMMNVMVDPQFEPYRSDPRFTAILEQMGLGG